MMMNFETATNIDNTSLRGDIKITYTELESIFGIPTVRPPIGEKTQAEWWLEFSDGTIATIYDWRSMYPVEEVTEWNIGGFNRDSVIQVEQVIEEHRNKDVVTIFDTDSESVSSSSLSVKEIPDD